MDVKKLKPEIIREIVLVALTYRTSTTTLAKVLKTTPEEINEIFNLEDDFRIPLYALKMETASEDEIDARVSYVHAHNYFAERNQIRKAIKEANKENNQGKVQELKLKMKEHFTKVDDTIVMGTIGRSIDVLTEKEREMIARYRLKYALSKITCGEILKHSRNSITKLDAELSERDVIFKEKITKLNEFWEERNLDHIKLQAEVKRNR